MAYPQLQEKLDSVTKAIQSNEKPNIQNLFLEINNPGLKNERSRKFYEGVKDYSDRVYELLENKCLNRNIKYNKAIKSLIRKKVENMLYEIKKQEIIPSNGNIDSWLDEIKELVDNLI